MSATCHLAFIAKLPTPINDTFLNESINIHEKPFVL